MGRRTVRGGFGVVRVLSCARVPCGVGTSDAVVQGWAPRDAGAEWCGRRGRCGRAAALAQGSPPPLPTVAAVYDVTLNFRGNKNPSLLGILYGKKYEADMCVR